MNRSAAKAMLRPQQRNAPRAASRHLNAKLLYTPEEAAALLSISRSRLYVLLARDAVFSIKEGRVRLIPAAALDQYVQRRLAEELPVTMVAEPVDSTYIHGRQA